MLWFPCWWPQS